MRRELEWIEIPGEHEAASAAWRSSPCVRGARSRVERPSAAAPRACGRRRGGALAAAVLSSPGRAVLDEVREVVGVERAQPALFSLPSPGRLLVASDAASGSSNRTARSACSARTAKRAGRRSAASSSLHGRTNSPRSSPTATCAGRSPAAAFASRAGRHGNGHADRVRRSHGDPRRRRRRHGRPVARAAWARAYRMAAWPDPSSRTPIAAGGSRRRRRDRRHPLADKSGRRRRRARVVVERPPACRRRARATRRSRGLHAHGRSLHRLPHAAWDGDRGGRAPGQPCPGGRQARRRTGSPVHARCPGIAFSGPGALRDPTWSPDARWLLVGWPALTSWYSCVLTVKRIRAVSNVRSSSARARSHASRGGAALPEVVPARSRSLAMR